MLSQLAVELEPDETGHHGIVTNAAGDVIYITDRCNTLEAAARAAWGWIFTQKENHMDNEVSETSKARKSVAGVNESCPRFVAYVSDSYVESDDNLEALIALVQRDGIGTGEDCVVWDSFHNVAAVILADGTVQRFHGRPEPPRSGCPSSPAPDDVDGRLQAVFLKRSRRAH